MLTADKTSRRLDLTPASIGVFGRYAFIIVYHAEIPCAIIFLHGHLVWPGSLCSYDGLKGEWFCFLRINYDEMPPMKH